MQTTLTTDGTTFIPGIEPGRRFTVALSGTFDGATVSVQYPTAAGVAATLDVDDDTDTPALTLTAAKAGTAGNSLSVEVLAADGYNASITHTVTTTGEAAKYSFQPATDTGTQSALTTALTGTHNDLVFTAVDAGTDGDSITVAYIDPSANDQTLSVEVTGTDIVVNLATGPAGAITTTANELRQAIIESAAASALVTVAFASSNDGTGVVTALTETALAGGADPAISSTSGDLVTYINSNCQGAFTAELVGDGTGTLIAVAETDFSGGTDGTFATYAGGETGAFTAAGERVFQNVSALPGVALTVTNDGASTSVIAIVSKVKD